MSPQVLFHAASVITRFAFEGLHFQVLALDVSPQVPRGIESPSTGRTIVLSLVLVDVDLVFLDVAWVDEFLVTIRAFVVLLGLVDAPQVYS